MWISSCDKLNIPITGKAAQGTLQDYRARQGAGTAKPAPDGKPSQKFTHEAFVDAIVEFIVADDQVSPYIKFSTKS